MMCTSNQNKTLSFGKYDASQYRIVTAKGAAYDIRHIAWEFQQLLRNRFGYEIEIVTDDVAPADGQKEIILGKTNRAASVELPLEKYTTAMTENGDYVINAGHYTGVQKVFDAIVQDIDTEKKDFVVIDARYAGIVTDVPLTWQADKDTEWQLESRYEDGELNTRRKRETPIMKTWTNDMTIGDLGFDFSDKYTLVWNDEFNGTALNYDKWSHLGAMYYPGARFTTGSPYVTVSDGKVHLISTMEKIGDKEYRYNVPYTLSTCDTMNFSGGYLEVRAKPPFRGMGEGPAIWMQSSTSMIFMDEYRQKHGLPRYPGGYNLEVDILENFGTTDRCSTNLLKWHYLDKDTNYSWRGMVAQGPVNSESPTDAGRGQRQYYFKSQEEAQEYHTWGFLWTDDMMAFSLDGKFYFATSLHDLDWDKADPNYQTWVRRATITADDSPYGKKHDFVTFGQKAMQRGNMGLQLYIDNTVMGENGRLQDNIAPGEYNPFEMHKYDDVRWPQRYDIEYVRLYQCKEDLLYTPQFYGEGTVMTDSERWSYARTGEGTPVQDLSKK